MTLTDTQLFQGTLFNPEGTEFRRKPARTLPLWRVESAISHLWYTGFATGGAWLIAVLWQEQTLWWLAAPLALTVPSYVWNFFRLKTRWRMAGHYLSPQELWSRGGLGHRFMTVTPYGRIQECSVSTNFWSRRFNLASIHVTVGARSSISVNDIEPEDAEKTAQLLRDLALKRGVQL